MNKMTTKPLLVLGGALLLSGCASMNKSECLQADWFLIGQLDASKGEHYSVLDEYRKDCADHGVTPDRKRYIDGFDEGLKSFCTRSQGFYFGKKGRKYQATCPPSSEGEFLEGYNPGRELFMISDVITTLNTGISSAEYEIRQLEEDIAEKEREMIKDGLTAEQRQKILSEIKIMHRDIFQLRQDIEDRRVKLRLRQLEYDKKLKTSTF